MMDDGWSIENEQSSIIHDPLSIIAPAPRENGMKQLLSIALLAIACGLPAAAAVFADEPKDAQPAEAQKQPPVKAHQVLDAFQAIGEAVGEFVQALSGSDRPAVVAEMAAVELGNTDPFVQQFMPQFRYLLKTELRFLRSVCQPDPQQYQLIQTAGEASLKDAVTNFADIQRKMQLGGFQAGNQPVWPDPRQVIATGLMQSVKATLSPEQAQRYEQELDRRAAARRRAARLNLITKLDKDLVLSAQQRGQLNEILAAHWNDAWVQQLEVFLYGDQYLPMLSDDQVLPILNARQTEIWQGLPKQQNTIWGWAGFGFLQLNMEDEIPADEIKTDGQPGTDSR